MASYVMLEALKDALRKWANGQEVVRVKDMERMIGSLAEKKVVGVLGDRRLHELEDAGMIQYDGPASIGPASLDLHLGNSFSKANPGWPVKLGDVVPATETTIKDGETMTVDELKDYVYSHMASHKVPKYVSFVAEFPMNAAGKILKYKMREQAIEALGLQKAADIVTA